MKLIDALNKLTPGTVIVGHSGLKFQVNKNTLEIRVFDGGVWQFWGNPDLHTLNSEGWGEAKLRTSRTAEWVLARLRQGATLTVFVSETSEEPRTLQLQNGELVVGMKDGRLLDTKFWQVQLNLGYYIWVCE